jgi:hypothetical protein
MENMRMFTAEDLKNGMPDMGGKDDYKYKPKKKTRDEHKKVWPRGSRCICVDSRTASAATP